jgi:hypothetical protein
MKRFLTHIGLGSILIVSLMLIDHLFCITLNWLDKKGIVGASWLSLGTFELLAAIIIVFILWLITFFRWQKRFKLVAFNVFGILLCLFGGTLGVAVLGFISNWLYNIKLWPIGMVVRIIEIFASVSVLLGLGYLLFAMIFGMFTKVEDIED